MSIATLNRDDEPERPNVGHFSSSPLPWQTSAPSVVPVVEGFAGEPTGGLDVTGDWGNRPQHGGKMQPL